MRAAEDPNVILSVDRDIGPKSHPPLRRNLREVEILLELRQTAFSDMRASTDAAWPNTGLDKCGMTHNKTIPATMKPINPFRFMGFLLQESRERATITELRFWFFGCAEYTAVCSRAQICAWDLPREIPVLC